jgi:hypothetical protein
MSEERYTIVGPLMTVAELAGTLTAMTHSWRPTITDGHFLSTSCERCGLEVTGHGYPGVRTAAEALRTTLLHVEWCEG